MNPVGVITIIWTSSLEVLKYYLLRWESFDIWLEYVSLICDKSVITQNLAFLSNWYRQMFADALLTGTVS
jgi:hypothetical protein